MNRELVSIPVSGLVAPALVQQRTLIARESFRERVQGSQSCLTCLCPAGVRTQQLTGKKRNRLQV